jgi:hypothetical protein
MLSNVAIFVEISIRDHFSAHSETERSSLVIHELDGLVRGLS